MTLQWRGPEIIRRVRQAAFRGVVSGANKVHAKATSLINEGPATGRVYERRGITHQASAPGEPPMSDTGRLAQSGEVRPSFADVAATVNWSTAYAEKLEMGTEKMAARPFARRSLAETKPEIEAGVAAEIRAVLG